MRPLWRQPQREMFHSSLDKSSCSSAATALEEAGIGRGVRPQIRLQEMADRFHDVELQCTGCLRARSSYSKRDDIVQRAESPATISRSLADTSAVVV